MNSSESNGQEKAAREQPEAVVGVVMSWPEYVEGVTRVRVARQRAMDPGAFEAFMRPFITSLTELAGQPVTGESFPLPPDAVLPADPHGVRAAQIYGEFLQAARLLYEQEVLTEIEALPGGEEDTTGRTGWVRERCARLRRLIWPTETDVAEVLADALYVYNATRAPAPAVALAELDALDRALSARDDIFAPLSGLVESLEAAHLALEGDEAGECLAVAFQRARTLSRARMTAVAGEEAPVAAVSDGEQAALAEWQDDPDQDPLWWTFLVCLFGALLAFILFAGSALLITRDLNSPWVNLACLPSFALFATGLLAVATLMIKYKRLESMGLYTLVEETEPSEPQRPMGRWGWGVLWGMLIVPVALAVAAPAGGAARLRSPVAPG